MTCSCDISPNKKSNTDEIAHFLKSISDKNRLQILHFLKDKKRCVCEIQDYMGIAQNLVSHHLKVLKEHKLVSCKKEGLKNFYEIERANLQRQLKKINRLFF